MAGNEDTLEQLKQALEHHRQALEALEEALLAELGSRQEAEGDGYKELLSLREVGEKLGMSKTWVYQRVSNGEIPSVRLGHNIKVRRADLDKYLRNQRYQPPEGNQPPLEQ